MPLQTCNRCTVKADLPGHIVGLWVCQGCLDREEAERRERHQRRLAECRQEYAERKRRFALLPGAVLPPTATDAEVQTKSDEVFGLEVERRADKIIIWSEM